MKVFQHILIFGLRLYQVCLSPVLSAVLGPCGLGCRFTPTCSQYAVEAIHRHGPARGAWLTLRRLGQCHPWGGSGFDPVPPRLNSQSASRQPSCGHGS